MLGVAAPTIMGDLGITEKEYSWITGFFQAGIMLQPIVGYVLDLIGLKLGFGLFALAWAVIIMLHGVATSWPMLAALRGLMGIGGRYGAAGRNEGGGRVVSGEGARLCRRLLQHRCVVRLDAGGAAGCVGHPVPQLAARVRDRRWHGAGVGGGVVPLLLLAEAASGTVEGRARATSNPDRRRTWRTSTAKPSILGLLKQRNVWGIAIPRLLADPTWGTLSFWVPLYLTRERGFDHQADRAVRLAAVLDRGHRLHGGPDHCMVAAEARRQPHQRPPLGIYRRRSC